MKTLWRRLERAVRSAPRNKVAEALALLQPVAVTRPLIRIGADRDGGYLLPDDLDGIVGAFSPGVSEQCGFDLDIAGRGVPVVMVDASVDGPPVAHPLFHFEKLFVDAVEDERSRRISHFIAMLPAEGDLVMQMDIEGAEYRVLAEADPALLRRFRIIALELHQLHKRLRREEIGAFTAMMRKLTADFDVVHVHINNALPPVEVRGHEVPPVIELTLHRKDRSQPTGASVTLPHPLDTENVPYHPPARYPAWMTGA